MDLLNDYYPLYVENPHGPSDDSEASENNDYIEQLDSLIVNSRKRRKKMLSIDDYCMKYGDDMWYIWCLIHDYSHSVNLFDKINYGQFCQLCYENSTKQ